MQKENAVRDMMLSVILLAATVIAGFLTDWLPFGERLLLTQIPVLLCGLLSGSLYGAIVGFLTPFLLFLLLGTPALYPDGIALAVEYMLFGAVASPVFRATARTVPMLYASLLTAMLVGRFGYIAAMYLMIELQHTPFSVQSLLKSEFVSVWAGLLLQLAAVPLLTLASERAGLLDRE